MSIDQHTAETMLDDLEKRKHKLSEWEQNFVKSIQAKIRNHKTAGTRYWLTTGQKAKIDEIWDRVTEIGA